MSVVGLRHFSAVRDQAEERVIEQDRAGRLDAGDQAVIRFAADGPGAARQVARGGIPFGADLARLEAPAHRAVVERAGCPEAVVRRASPEFISAHELSIEA